MKRFITLVLTICMCLTIMATLSACNTDTTHNHTYQTVWSSDSTHHWYACEDETCTSTSQKGEHQFVNGICSVCSFEDNIETPPPATLVSNEVTEEQFYTALSIGDENIITITYTYNYAEVIGNAVLHINKNVIYFETDDNINGTTEVYYDLQEENSYLYSYLIFDEPYEYSGWVRQVIDPDDETHIAPQALEKFESMFSMVDFSNCEYSDGYYTCLVEAMTWKFQFEDGVLVSFSNTYVDDTEGFSETYIFSDYGNTVVSLPTEYIDIDEISPAPSSDWASYFEFDNVTIQKTWTYPTYSVLETIKINQNCWEYSADGGIYNYFDGNTLYGSGAEMYNEPLSILNSFLYPINLFENYEFSFTETSDNIYTATECVDVTNIIIVVNDKKIASVKYDIQYDNETASITYIFSDWETTVAENSSDTATNWVDYFDFESLENVTATSIFVYDYYKDSTMQQTTKTTTKICGDEIQEDIVISYLFDFDEDGEWENTFFGDSWDTSDIYYTDGTAVYKNGVVQSDMIANAMGQFYEAKFYADKENYFTEISNGVYTASCIPIDGGVYQNIKIVIEDNRIQYIEEEYISDGITSKSTLLFSNWGTTTID